MDRALPSTASPWATSTGMAVSTLLSRTGVWRFSSGMAREGPGGFSSTLQNPSIPAATPAHSGVYRVAVHVGACSSAETSVPVTVLPAPPCSGCAAASFGPAPKTYFVKDTIVRGNSVAGVSLVVLSGEAAASSIDRTRLESNGAGLVVGNGSKASIRRSVASGNESGLVADGTGAELDADACLVVNNGTVGIAAGPSGGIVRVSRSTVTGNSVGLQQSGAGTFLSRTDNTVEGNSTNTSGILGSYLPR